MIEQARLIEQATLVVDSDRLLKAIWYPDGSGSRGLGAGIDGPSTEWRLESISLQDDGYVRLRLVRKKEWINRFEQ